MSVAASSEVFQPLKPMHYNLREFRRLHSNKHTDKEIIQLWRAADIATHKRNLVINAVEFIAGTAAIVADATMAHSGYLSGIGVALVIISGGCAHTHMKAIQKIGPQSDEDYALEHSHKLAPQQPNVWKNAEIKLLQATVIQPPKP